MESTIRDFKSDLVSGGEMDKEKTLLEAKEW